MSLIVGRISNKFWNNSSYKQPNNFPIYADAKILEDVKPSLTSFMGGDVYLHGAHGNHCIYKGAYYALQILQVLDQEREWYHYRLERELGFDVLANKAKVVGDLSTSSDEELLEKHLSRTYGALDNPGRITTINFKDVNFDGKKFFTYKKSIVNLPQKVLSKDDFDGFLSCMRSWTVQNGKTIDEDYYSGNRNPAVFIFGFLEPTLMELGWKERLRIKINDFLDSINGSNKDNLKISKVPNKFASRIEGNYCITGKQDGIGTSEEALELDEIDLSGLTDIIPVNLHDLKEIEPATPLDVGNAEKGGIFTGLPKSHSGSEKLFKIVRKPHIPVNCSEEYVSVGDKGGGFKRPEFNGKIKPPQIIKGNYIAEDKAFLGGVDNLNFSIVATDENAIHSITGSHSVTTFRYNQIKEDERWKDFRNQLKFDIPNPGTGTDSYRDADKLVSFGFLIFQPFRDPAQGNLFKYEDEGKLRKIKYYAGFKNDFFEYYDREHEEKGGNKLPPDLAKIQPSKVFTKFYLDNYAFSGLSFFPSDTYDHGARFSGHEGETYLGSDIYGTGKFTNYNYGTDRAIRSDIYDITGNGKETNPFGSNYSRWREQKERQLRSLLLFEEIDLPNDLELEKEDFFFTEQEYEIKEFKTPPNGGLKGRDWIDPVGKWKNKQDFMKRLYRLEDFTGQGFDSKDSIPEEGSIVVCSNLQGKLEIRSLFKFNASFRLSDSKSQLVTSVNDSTFLNQNCYLLKKVAMFMDDPEKLSDEEGFKYEEKKLAKEKLLYGFYKRFGYKTKLVGNVAHWTGFSEKDFSEESTDQFLFDLVGTNGYCFITKGKISLIGKDVKNFSSISGTHLTLDHEENKDLNFSLLEKVNQKVRFQFLTVPYYLNGKTTFSDRDRINLQFESLKPTELADEFSQFFVNLRTGFDVIWWENLQIPKKRSPTKALSLADSVQVQKLNLDLVRDAYQHSIAQDRIELADKRYQEQFRRAEREIGLQQIKTGVNAGTSLLGGAVGLGVLAKMGSGVTSIIREKGAYRNNFKQTKAFVKWATANPEQAARFPKVHFTGSRETIVKTNPAKMGLAISGFASQAVTSAINMGLDYGLRFPEMQKRIKMDRRLAANELAVQSLVMETEHMDRQLNAQLGLNVLMNRYDNPNISEANIAETFREKQEGHGKKLKEAYLVVYTPTTEQLRYLKEYTEEFGYMCDIPDITTEFVPGMKEGIIRYRNIDNEGITNLANPIVKDYLYNRMMVGTKIVPLKHVATIAPTTSDYKHAIFRLETSLSQQKSEHQEQVKQLETEIQNKGTNLASLVNELDETKKKLEECKKEGEKCKEIAVEAAGLSEQLETCKTALEKEKKEHQESNEEKEKIKKDLDKCKKDAEEHEEKVRQIVIKTEQDFSERVKGLNDQIRQKQNELNDANSRIAALQRNLNDCRAREGKPKLSCEQLKKFLNTQYEYDLKPNSDGGSKFLDLIAEIAENLIWMRREDIDHYLAHYPQMRKIFERLYELEEIQAIDRSISAQKSHPSQNKETVTRINSARFVKTPQVHAVKALLDELNWLSYNAQKELATELQTDRDLQHFFAHIYPGKTKELYDEIFGDSATEIKKREFLKIPCASDGDAIGVPADEGLDRIDKATVHTIDNIPKSPSKQPPSSPTVPELEEGTNRLDDRNIFSVFQTTDLRGHEDGKNLAKRMNPKDSKSSLGISYIKTRSHGHNMRANLYYSYIEYKDYTVRSDSGFKESEKTTYVYVRNRYEQNITDKVQNARNLLGQKRKEFKLSQNVELSLNAGTLIRHFTIRNYAGLNPRSSESYGVKMDLRNDTRFSVDLVKLFGKENARDALILFGIMDACKIGLEEVNDFKGYGGYEVGMRTGQFENLNDANFNQYGDPWQRTSSIIEMEFANPMSLLNYIYKHVKSQKELLDNTYGFNFGNMYRSNKDAIPATGREALNYGAKNRDEYENPKPSSGNPSWMGGAGK